ncbi:hypothetical protein PS15m_005652 [Mucor circinelloides]
MNCLKTRCTPVSFDIQSPVANLIVASTTTAASSPVAAEATLSFPITPVVEVLTPLVVASRRSPTPHPSILDIEPFSEMSSITDAAPPSLLQVELYRLEPLPVLSPLRPPSSEWNPFGRRNN